MSKFFKQQGLILDGEDFSRGRNDMENRKLQDEINSLKKKKTGIYFLLYKDLIYFMKNLA